MAIKIRLARGGSKKRPFYRIVAADSRMPRDGRFIEKLGTYNPLLPKDNENRVSMNVDRIKHWIGLGAQLTDRIQRMLEASEVLPRKERNNPKKGLARAEKKNEKQVSEQTAGDSGNSDAEPKSVGEPSKAGSDVTADLLKETQNEKETAGSTSADDAPSPEMSSNPDKNTENQEDKADNKKTDSKDDVLAATSTEKDAPSSEPEENSEEKNLRGSETTKTLEAESETTESHETAKTEK